MAGKKLGPEFTYDMGDLLKVDPNLIHFDEAPGLATGMAAPRGIALGADDRLYVAGDQAVRCFGADGKILSEFKTAGEPQRVAVTRAGTTYVAMTDHVEVYDGQGRRQAAWPAAAARSLLTCVAALDNDVFVADAAACLVLHYDATGRLINRIGAEDAAKKIPGIVVPSPYFDVAVGDKRTIWVANPGRRRVEHYTYDGGLMASWGRASPKIQGFCGCCNPTHIALLADGRFVTSEKGLPRVKVYSAAGEFKSVVAPPAVFAEGTVGLDVAADSRGRILVLEPAARKVRIFVRKKTGGTPEPKS